MPIDWKLNDELDELWHSSFWLLFLLWQPKYAIFRAKKWASDFRQKHENQIFQKCDISFRFFNRSLAKST